MSGSALDPLDRLPIHAGKIGFGEGREGGNQAPGCRGYPQALQQQVVEAESQIKSRIAEPRALRINEDRAVRTDQYVLRADIAMDKGQFRAGGNLGKPMEGRGAIGMRASGSQQVWFEPNCVKDRVGSKFSFDLGAPREPAVNACQAAADLSGIG